MHYFITAFFFYSFGLMAQINPWQGIIDLDSCDFETNCEMLRMDTSSLLWQIANPSQKQYLNTAHSPTMVMLTDSTQSYPPNTYDYFDLVVSVGWNFGLILDFWHRYDTDTLADGGYIEISYDKGQSWNNLSAEPINNMHVEFNTENLYSNNSLLYNGSPGFTGRDTGWVHTKVQWTWALPLKQMNYDTIIFRFSFVSDSIHSNKDGWMIDDIKIAHADYGSFTNHLNAKSTGLNLYPQPCVRELFYNLASTNLTAQSYTIFDMMGGVLMQGMIDNQEQSMHIEALKPGSYILKLNLENDRSIVKLFTKKGS